MARQDKLEEADNLIQLGRTAEARTLLLDVLRTNSSDEEVCSSIVDLLALGRLYTEARSVFSQYKGRTGKELRADLSLDNIEKQEKANQHYLSGEYPKIFKQRWLRLLREVHLFPDRVVFKSWIRSHSYRWQEITQARLESIDSLSSYTPHREILTLKTSDRKVRFELTPLEHLPTFLELLQRHLTIRKDHSVELGKLVPRRWAFIFLILFCLYAVTVFPLIKQTVFAQHYDQDIKTFLLFWPVIVACLLGQMKVKKR